MINLKSVMNTCIRTILGAFLALLSLTSYAQDYPKLNELSEKELLEKLAPAERNGKWGYANEDGKFRIKACFDSAGEFFQTVHKGETLTCAKVSYEGKFGYLNEKGVFLLLPDYDSMSDFDRGVAVFSKGGNNGLISASGEVLALGFAEITAFDINGIAWLRRGDVWGACDLEGKTVFEPRYDAVPDKAYGDLVLVQAGESYGLVSLKERRIVLEPVAEWIGPDVMDASILLYRRGMHFGCIGTDGVNILAPDCELIAGGYENGHIMFRRAGKYGLCDRKGNLLIPAVMNTDQISEGRPFYRFFDESTGFRMPKVFYKGEALTLKAFDDKVFAETGADGYMGNDVMTIGRYPIWLMGHVRDIIPPSAFRGYWSSDNAYLHPGLMDMPAAQDPSGVPVDERTFVTVGRDKKVIQCEGLGLEPGATLSKATMPIDTLAVPCGSWLTPLFNVSSDRLAGYDRAMGTTVAKDWQTLTARVRNRGLVPDGDAVAVIDIMVDTLLMQRHFVKFTLKGTRRQIMTQDGILYDRVNYVNNVQPRYFQTADMFVIPVCIGAEKALKTRLYTKAAKLVTELGDLYCELMLDSSSGLKMLGRDAYSFCKSEVDMTSRKYTKDDLGVMSENMSVDYYDGHAYFYETDTKVCKSILETGTDCMPIPALRYARDDWDGKAVVGVSANMWDVLSESAWIAVPRALSEPRAENVNGYMLTVYPPGPDGISIYSINPDIWTNEGLRYGFIGYDVEFFTQALFENARDFVGGVTKVMVNGAWVDLKKEDVLKQGNKIFE